MDKQKIIGLITENEHEEALTLMADYATQNKPQYNTEIANHKRNLNKLENDNRIGIISRDEYQRDMARLTMAILKLLDLMEKNEPIKENSNPPNQGGVNIGNINITGGNVQIADIINNIKKD